MSENIKAVIRHNFVKKDDGNKKLVNSEILDTKESLMQKIEAEKGKKKNKISLKREIACMSYCTGKLYYTSNKTGEEFLWREMGEVLYLPYEELVFMKKKYPVYLTEPWVIILDQDVIENLDLSDLYENKIIFISEFDDWMKKDWNEKQKSLKNMSNESVRNIGKHIAKMIENQQITNVFDLTVYSEMFGCDFIEKMQNVAKKAIEADSNKENNNDTYR